LDPVRVAAMAGDGDSKFALFGRAADNGERSSLQKVP
jgi:hypothetical protein